MENTVQELALALIENLKSAAPNGAKLKAIIIAIAPNGNEIAVQTRFFDAANKRGMTLDQVIPLQ